MCSTKVDRNSVKPRLLCVCCNLPLPPDNSGPNVFLVYPPGRVCFGCKQYLCRFQDAALSPSGCLHFLCLRCEERATMQPTSTRPPLPHHQLVASRSYILPEHLYGHFLPPRVLDRRAMSIIPLPAVGGMAVAADVRDSEIPEMPVPLPPTQHQYQQPEDNVPTCTPPPSHSYTGGKCPRGDLPGAGPVATKRAKRPIVVPEELDLSHDTVSYSRAGRKRCPPKPMECVAAYANSKKKKVE